MPAPVSLNKLFDNMITCRHLLLSALVFCATPSMAQDLTAHLQHIVDTTYAAHPGTIGIVVSVVSPSSSKPWVYAVGYSDKAAQAKLSAQQPLQLASNTKTYVSAGILRLVEQDKLKLSDGVSKYLEKETAGKLTADGYDLDKITLRHLLSHTSGMADYVNDEYFAFVNANRRHRWTRDEQIDLAVKVGSPLAAPGDTFKYADVNYLLLGKVIESVTGKPFYTALRGLLNYKGNKLSDTWFETLEPTPAGIAPRVHQYWNKYPWDSYELDPSWDLYGGGGIVATPADVAEFYYHLFEGHIIKDKAVLAEMYKPIPAKSPNNYSLGIRTLKIGGLTGYYHGGFWGTDAIYFPEIRTAIFIAILEKGEKDISGTICKDLVSVLKSKE